MLVPVSAAMDATATCGGPITMLPEIVTGEPTEILLQVEGLLRKAAQFAQLVAQFEQAQQQLERAWSGGAAESAIKKIVDSLGAFNQIITVVEEGAALLGVSAGLVTAAQAAYDAVVQAVNPVVQGLMSNPWTYAAAVALSTAASALLRAFIEVQQVLLQALGGVKIATQVMTLAQIINEIDQLANRGTGGHSGSGPAAVSTPPVIAPPPPSTVGSLAGGPFTGTLGGSSLGGSSPGGTSHVGSSLGGAQPGWYPPTAGPYAPAATAYPGGGVHPDVRAGSGAGWIPVDSVAQPGSQPGSPSGTGSDVTVTVTEHGVATTVGVPAGHGVGVDVAGDGRVSMDVHGQHPDAGTATDGTQPTPAVASRPIGHTPMPNASHTPTAPAAPAAPAAPPPPAVPRPGPAATHPHDDTVVTVTQGGTTTTVDVPADDEVIIEIDGAHVTERVVPHTDGAPLSTRR